MDQFRGNSYPKEKEIDKMKFLITLFSRCGKIFFCEVMLIKMKSVIEAEINCYTSQKIYLQKDLFEKMVT